MSEHHRWAPHRPLTSTTRAEQRRYEAEERYNRHEIANRFNELFEELRLVHPDGHPVALLGWQEPPEVGRVTLGPPTRMTVRPRPGLRRQHLVAVGDLLASAFEVDAVEVTDFSGGWLVIEMIEGVPAGRPEHPADPPPTTALPPVADEPSTGPPTSRIRWHRNPLGRRRRRRPFGGPRTGR